MSQINRNVVPNVDLKAVYAFEKPYFAPEGCVKLNGDQPCEVLTSIDAAKDRFIEPIGGQLELGRTDIANTTPNIPMAGKEAVRQEVKQRAAKAAAGTCRFICEVPHCWRREED